MPNQVVIEGHTDSRPFRNASGGYSNWELSSRSRQRGAPSVVRVWLESPADRGGARLCRPEVIGESDPESARNRRISLVVKFLGD